MNLLPCPFCGSTNIDPEGWASTNRAGPACDDCAGTADTVELWNSRKATNDMVERGVRALAALRCDPHEGPAFEKFVRHMRPTWEPDVQAVLDGANQQQTRERKDG